MRAFDIGVFCWYTLSGRGSGCSRTAELRHELNGRLFVVLEEPPVSVIPLVVSGANRTVVVNQREFDTARRAVLLQGAEIAQFTEAGTSNVSYDLRIGERYRDHKERTVKQLSEPGEITLKPRAAFIIETAEYLQLPVMMYGSIAPKVSLLQRGLSTTYSKVDPGYRGHLLVTLFNLGETTVTLQRGQRFCALTILDVSEGARLYDKEPKQLDTQLAGEPRRKAREWLEEKHIYITIAWMVATVLTALEGLMVFLRSRHPN